jgi:hypothetical protein
VHSQDFYDDPAASLRRVFEFLNVPDCSQGEYRPYNHANYPQMDPKMRKQLNEFFEPHNERLSAFLNIDLDWS